MYGKTPKPFWESGGSVHLATTLHSRTKLNTDEIIFLLKFTLSINYLMFNDSVYKTYMDVQWGAELAPS